MELLKKRILVIFGKNKKKLLMMKIYSDLLGRFKSKETDFVGFKKNNISRYIDPIFMLFMSKNSQHSFHLNFEPLNLIKNSSNCKNQIYITKLQSVLYFLT